MTTHGGTNRIEFLDALRGAAILLVVLFHAYARWPEVVPYGDRFSRFPIFSYGWLGVELFFMISGFVIFLTLDKCGSFLEFITRRWLRLFPAMLACSLLIWLTASFVPERPAGLPTADQLIPGLTFIKSVWLDDLGLHTKPIEGAFWSLFVEAQFYLIVGLAYFFAGGRRAALSALILMIAFAVTASIVQNHFGALASTKPFRAFVFLSDRLDAHLYCWFAIGAFSYIYYTRRSPEALIFAALIACVAVVYQNELMTGIHTTKVKLSTALVILLFALPVVSGTARSILGRREFLFMGYLSYPLYLLHENLMIALIVKIGRWFPGFAPIAIPLLPIGFVMLVAWLVAAYAEPSIKRALQHALGPITARRAPQRVQNPNE
jgi:peptidoglycan/LPS O-acetylase OafA/YrhL